MTKKRARQDSCLSLFCRVQIFLLLFLYPNLFLDKDAQLVEEHKESRDEEASHKDMVQVSEGTNINQDGKKVEDD